MSLLPACTAVGAIASPRAGGCRFSALIHNCWARILNGPPISMFAIRGLLTFSGSGHRSVQMPPQPYSELMLRS